MGPKTDERRRKKTKLVSEKKTSTTKKKTDTSDVNSQKPTKYLTGQQKRKASASALLPGQKLKRRKINNSSDPETVDSGDCKIPLMFVPNEKKKTSKEKTRKTRQAVQNRKKPGKRTKAEVKKEEDTDDTLEELNSKPKKTTRVKSRKLIESREEVEKSIAEVQRKTRGRVSKKAGDKKVNVKKEEQIEMKSVLTPGIRGLSKHAKANKYVGAHTSISGGLQNAVHEAVMIGARAFGMFLKSQRQWACKPLQDKDADNFKQAMQECGFSPDMVVPHGSYLLNCGAPNEETLQKSRDGLTDELQRCEKLGLTMFNFHPGSTCKQITVEKCLSLIAESINIAHSKTKYVTAVLENMSCQGGTVGGNFSELASIIDQVKDKSRVGVCLDTCHAFAAGYDLRTEAGYKQTMSEFEKVVGLKYLRAVHVNDSKGELGCHLDRHENIGRGKLGLDAFRFIMNDPRFNNIPFVLETPEIDYSREIRKLYSLCKT